MADVFLSYAREDTDIAKRLASALVSKGLSVWWDRNILAGKTFDQLIEQELESAKCVVVLWSRDSVRSEWARNEAAAGAERGVLIPAAIDATRPPLEFRRRQTADLAGWSGGHNHKGYLDLLSGVRSLLSQAPAITESRNPYGGPEVTSTAQARSRSQLKNLLLVSALAVVGVGAWIVGERPDRRPSSTSLEETAPAHDSARPQAQGESIIGSWRGADDAMPSSDVTQQYTRYDFRSDGRFIYTATFTQKISNFHVSIHETGTFKVDKRTITVIPASKTYSRNSVTSSEPVEVRTYSWQLSVPPKTQKRQLSLTIGPTTLAFIED